ncbi:MAG: class I SAM-dependent methyltransferase [Thermoleophilia bacterium]
MRKPTLRHAPARGATAPPGRRALRPEPPPRRTPLTPVARRAALAVLGRPVGGEVALRLPDGTTRRAGDAAEGRSVEITVRSNDLFRRIATRGGVGVGEAYAAGDWTADDLAGAVEILLLTGEAARRTAPGRALTRLQRSRPFRASRPTLPGARRDIGYHYDLGNDLYALFLDPTWTYSCAVFERPGMTLEEAQRAKYRRICDKLGLGPGSHVLEIGCGWGGFALHAAREYGARVTGITLSERQAALARERVAAAGVADRVEIRLVDYREMRGEFTHIASIEMLEAVGHDQLPVFFGAVDRLLAPAGAACIQTIAVPDQRYERYRRRTDWIREYIFPGALIPSMEAINRALARSTELMLEDAENIGPHYAETLRRWREGFLADRAAVRALGYDERFVRAWEFYLASCEAAFRVRSLHDYQLVLTRSYEPRRPVRRGAAPDGREPPPG